MRSLTFVILAIFITSFTPISLAFDVNGNDKAELPEAAQALQFVSGMTQAPASSTMSQIRIYCS